MKPMLALIVFGLSVLGVSAFIAVKNFDGVVETKTYEASLKYDQSVADIKSVENAIGKITVNKDGMMTSVKVETNASKTAYQNIRLENVALVRPLGSDNIPLKHSGDNFFTEDNVEKGWYNASITLDADGKTVRLQKSVYID